MRNFVCLQAALTGNTHACQQDSLMNKLCKEGGGMGNHHHSRNLGHSSTLLT